MPHAFSEAGRRPKRPPVREYIARWSTQAARMTQRGGSLAWDLGLVVSLLVMGLVLQLVVGYWKTWSRGTSKACAI